MYYFIVFNLKTLLFLFMTQAIHKTWVVFAVTLLISLVGFLISYKLFKKHKHFIVFVFYALFSSLMFADVLYCLYFNRLLSVSMQTQINQLPGVGNVIIGIINVWVLFFIIDLPFLAYYFKKKKSFRMHSLKVPHFKLSLSVSLIVLCFLLYNHSQTIKAYEFFTYHAVDIVNTLSKEEMVEREIETHQLIKQSQGISGPLTGIAKDRNIIIIQVEALQSIALNLSIDEKEITPTLNQILKDQGTIYFDDFYQSVARGNTSDAEFAMLNSLYPSTEQIVYQEAYDKNYYSLAQLLGDEGYYTSYFHANEGEFYNRNVMTQSLGFDYFYDASKFDMVDESEIISYGLNDFSFFNQSLNYIEKLDQSSSKWMSFLISLSSHAPFILNEQDKTLHLTDDNENIALNYFESVHYFDSALGEFIQGLKDKGLYDDSVLVIYGDHFGLNASIDEQKEGIDSLLGIDYSIQQMMNVPLMIHIPNTNIHQINSKVGSQIDIYPTLIDLLGLENEKGVMLGQDLLNSKKPNQATLQYFLPDGSYIDDEFLFVAARDNELQHSELLNRQSLEIFDSSFVENQLLLNENKLELSRQLILLDKIRK